MITYPLTGVILVVCTLLVYRTLKRMDYPEVPEERFTLSSLFDVIYEALYNFTASVIPEGPERFLSLIGTLFIFIFFSNLWGVIPGMAPPTDKLDTNVAMAGIVFVAYNYYGFKAHGIKYIKHFMGPIWWLAPIMLVVEVMSNMVRPFSLSLRLFGNMLGDHTVLGIFSHLLPVLVPIFFMVLGIFVSFIQALIFSILSAVYIALAVAHEEED
ncbi:MAG: F0F1 ATP synthase subunit A [Deltaproteobacteria bacterium]|nr:F0F1 ATP synthase subunit A [Deltaproteobacteria bacterium]MCL5277343.1 F0F1 ATP synthase subunit A [Deltaproteobacteria bacterium]